MGSTAVRRAIRHLNMDIRRVRDILISPMICAKAAISKPVSLKIAEHVILIELNDSQIYHIFLYYSDRIQPMC